MKILNCIIKILKKFLGDNNNIKFENKGKIQKQKSGRNSYNYQAGKDIIIGGKNNDK